MLRRDLIHSTGFLLKFNYSVQLINLYYNSLTLSYPLLSISTTNPPEKPKSIIEKPSQYLKFLHCKNILLNY